MSATQKRNTAYAQYFNGANGNSTDTWLFKTKDLIYKGILTVKKLDTINQIISGTFWFTAVNSNGDTVKITDGRFDVYYTR